jgi:hypothetical protein
LEKPEEKTVKNGSATNAEIKERLAATLPPIESLSVSGITLPIRQHVFIVYAGVFFVEFVYKAITR